MTTISTTRQPSRLGALRKEWAEIGGLGRLAVVAVVVAVAAALGLGLFITSTTRHQLLGARASMLSASVDALPAFPDEPDASPADLVRFDVAVRLNVLGGETVRVKVWAPDGTVLYSDATELIGRRFELSEPALDAFGGGTGTLVSDLSDPAHAVDRERGELIEFYIPVHTDATGTPHHVIEIEQDASSFNAAMGRITATVWIAIGLTIARLAIVMGVAAAARARELNRRRKQAERLLEQSFRAQEEERRRVVGALHDDIGQPMYRLLYGLEGLKTKVATDDSALDEVVTLAGTVREMDETLRAELRLLHFELAADAGLETALRELADLTSDETGLDIALVLDIEYEPDPATRTEIYRAAREAVTNVRKHAGADRIVIRVRSGASGASIDVDDDGVGFDDQLPAGLGMSTMRERFTALGGTVAAGHSPLGGVRLTGWLPATAEEPS